MWCVYFFNLFCFNCSFWGLQIFFNKKKGETPLVYIDLTHKCIFYVKKYVVNKNNQLHKVVRKLVSVSESHV